MIIGVDYGVKRVGFAVSDPSLTMALTREVVEVRSPEEALNAVVRVVEEARADRVVVGLPLNMDGSVGPMAEAVNRFVDQLRARLPVPVSTWDERLSTAMVERSLIESDVSRQKRKRLRDKLAAQAILQSALDAGGFRCSAAS